VTTVVLDLNDVGLDYTDSLWTGEIGLATVIVEPGDEAAEVQVGTLEFVLTDEEYAAGREAGYALFRLRSYDAGAGQLRVVVRDPETGATGSLWVTLD
jgi:hypothetical protein